MLWRKQSQRIKEWNSEWRLKLFLFLFFLDLLQILLVSFLSETVQAWKSGNLLSEKPKNAQSSSELTVLWLVSCKHYCRYSYEFMFLPAYRNGNTQNGVISLPQTPIVRYPDNINLKGEHVHSIYIYMYVSFWSLISYIHCCCLFFLSFFCALFLCCAS